MRCIVSLNKEDIKEVVEATIRSDQEYETAKKIIKELEPMLNQKYRGVVPEEEYMLLWDTIFEVMDIVDSGDTVGKSFRHTI